MVLDCLQSEDLAHLLSLNSSVYLTNHRTKMLRSLGVRPLTRLVYNRCVSISNLADSCVARNFSSSIRQYQKETDINDDIDGERKWSTPLAKQLFAAISVSQLL